MIFRRLLFRNVFVVTGFRFRRRREYRLRQTIRIAQTGGSGMPQTLPVLL